MADAPTVELLLVGTGEIHIPYQPMENRRLQLQRRTIVIGRDPARVDVCLSAVPAISRVHCTIHYDESEATYYVIDNDSAYGVFINGKKLSSGQWYPLANGTEIELSGARVGGTLLRFYILQPENAEPPLPTKPGTEDRSHHTTILHRPTGVDMAAFRKPTEPGTASRPVVPAAPALEKRIFLSYCRQDGVLMQFVANHLRSQKALAGIDIWTDEKLQIAEAWSDKLQEMLDRSAALLVLVSPHTKTSEWVRNEIRYASDHQKRIFPLVIHGDPREVMPLELIRAQYIDLNPNPMSSLEKLTQAIASHFKR